MCINPFVTLQVSIVWIPYYGVYSMVCKWKYTFLFRL